MAEGTRRGRRIREIDPQTGRYVTHDVAATREYERLAEAGVLNRDEEDAAQRLRNDFERSGLLVGRLCAQSYGEQIQGGERDLVKNENAFRRFRRAMAVFQGKPILEGHIRACVLGDIDLGRIAAGYRSDRATAADRLKEGLGMLVQHYGINGRRN